MIKISFFSCSTVITSQYNHLGTQLGDNILGNISCQHKQVCDRTPILTVEGGPSKDCKREDGSHKQASGVAGRG